MAPASGGERVRLSTGTMLLEVTVPAGGSYGSLPNGPIDAEIGLRICHLESNSLVVISALSGREIERQVGDATGAAVLDQVAASAVLRPQPDRPGSEGVRPPGTGDGGLLPAAAAE
jgi:hypothetical protein